MVFIPGAGNGTFPAPRDQDFVGLEGDFPVRLFSENVTPDLDGDGEPDVVFVGGQQGSGNYVFVGLGNGAGAFATTRYIMSRGPAPAPGPQLAGRGSPGRSGVRLSGSWSATSTATASLDIATGNAGSARPGGVSLLLGAAPGAFRAARSFSVPNDLPDFGWRPQPVRDRRDRARRLHATADRSSSRRPRAASTSTGEMHAHDGRERRQHRGAGVRVRDGGFEFHARSMPRRGLRPRRQPRRRLLGVSPSSGRARPGALRRRCGSPRRRGRHRQPAARTSGTSSRRTSTATASRTSPSTRGPRRWSRRHRRVPQQRRRPRLHARRRPPARAASVRRRRLATSTSPSTAWWRRTSTATA